MKKLLSLALATFMLTMTLCSCSTENSKDDTPADLRGEWIQERDGGAVKATITDDAIEVNLYVEEMDMDVLFWAGTYEAPTKSGAYSWDSINDKEKTSSALLASEEEKLTFNYADDEITFTASFMGEEGTFSLKRSESDSK